MRTYQWLTLGAAILIAVLEIWFFTDASALAAQADAPPAAVSLASRRGAPLPIVAESGDSHGAWNAAATPDASAGAESYFVYCAAGARSACAAILNYGRPGDSVRSR